MSDDYGADALQPTDHAPKLSAAQAASLVDFWKVYDEQYDRVQQAAMQVALDHPEFGPLLRAMPAEQLAQDDRRSRELIRGAIERGQWAAYLENARTQGALYAKLGVSFAGWYSILRVFQHVLVPSLVATYGANPERLSGAIAAMMSFLDHAMSVIAEEYLRTREADRFRVLVESIQDYGVFMLDPQGTIVSWNAGARKLKGYDDAEIIGKHFSIFYPPQERDEGKPEEELRITATVGRFEEEGWRVRKDGSRFWANVVLNAVRDPRGKLTGFAKVTRDLTERRRAEIELRSLVERLENRGRQLEEANRELDGFTYSVSHDLRAPLRAIDGFARVLIEDHAPTLDEDGQRVVQVIVKNAEKMGQLIDDLLNFARLGRQELRRARLDMAALARAVAQEVAEPARTIDFRVGDLPPAHGDPAMVRQVWVNLLSNAVKYTRHRAAPVVDVTASGNNGEVIYSIKDNGVGFDPRYLSKLFGVFQRLHTASEFEGTGVGLALVQRIVHRHGGWVKAEGTPGEGATFSFALPRKDRVDGP